MGGEQRAAGRRRAGAKAWRPCVRSASGGLRRRSHRRYCRTLRSLAAFAFRRAVDILAVHGQFWPNWPASGQQCHIRTHSPTTSCVGVRFALSVRRARSPLRALPRPSFGSRRGSLRPHVGCLHRLRLGGRHGAARGCCAQPTFFVSGGRRAHTRPPGDDDAGNARRRAHLRPRRPTVVG